MINALELYCILKLDAVYTTLMTVSVITGVVFLPLFIIAYANENESEKKTCRKLESLSSEILLFVTVPALILALLCPTTKQAAAIFIVPKLATQENIEHLSKEYKELYSIAKEAFTNFVENNKEGK